MAPTLDGVDRLPVDSSGVGKFRPRQTNYTQVSNPAFGVHRYLCNHHLIGWHCYVVRHGSENFIGRRHGDDVFTICRAGNDVGSGRRIAIVDREVRDTASVVYRLEERL